MNAEVFAEWFRRQGRHVYRTATSYWHDAGHRVLQAFPYHWIIEPTEKEIKKLLWEKSALALRYSAPITAANVMKSYHIVCDRPDIVCHPCAGKHGRMSNEDLIMRAWSRFLSPDSLPKAGNCGYTP